MAMHHMHDVVAPTTSIIGDEEEEVTIETTKWGAWAHRGHRLWASMSEDFWIHVYKVQRWPRSSSHDWTSCPYAHKGERARRRDTRRFACAHGLRCRYAHGVFELWLHPSRFRTRMCSAGTRCPRRICFFAHSAAELRDDPNSIASAILTPMPMPMPMSIPMRTPDADHHPRVSAMRDQLDLIEEAMRNRLRLYSNANANANVGSSSATAVATTTIPVSTLANGEGSTGKRCGCRRCVEEEDALLNGYPHYDLIMDLVDE
ncbi:hypothetical protein OsJ_25506 [Oryza sativa Japonica Group]|uniref:AtC3H23-like CCCH zinc finger domain-containing protein n=1 Tax=Oryza sativa subsp. japonica TaxID=39947 RepID=A3BN81_ORYSJ|nr:hypothetical protein OsJ_25506 [Oryza sativa Japonica Group]